MQVPPTIVEPVYSLKQAVERFFPNSPLTVASLRHEIRKGRLQATMPAGKLLVTERALVEMLERCRVPQNNPTLLASEHRQAPEFGLSETERIARAQACAADLMTRKRSGR